VEAVHQEYSAFRYCTNYLVEGPQVDCSGLERALERLDAVLQARGADAARAATAGLLAELRSSPRAGDAAGRG
jgi:hypothetical protein